MRETAAPHEQAVEAWARRRQANGHGILRTWPTSVFASSQRAVYGGPRVRPIAFVLGGAGGRAGRRRRPFLECIILALSLAAFESCSKAQSVLLATSTTLLPHQPLTIKAPEPLQVVGSLSELRLQIQPLDSLSRLESGVRRRDGRIIQVGAVMLRGDESSDTITALGYSMSPGQYFLAIRPSDRDSLHPPFVAVRITASDSLTVSKIIWSSTRGW